MRIRLMGTCACLLSLAFVVAACGDDDDDGGGVTGGAAGSTSAGGSTSTGGSTSSGGSTGESGAGGEGGAVSGVVTLDVTQPDGGSIAVTPSGGTYQVGDTVTLTWSAAQNQDDCYSFTEWSGDATGSTTTTTLVMDGDKSIGAVIDRPSVTLSLTDPADGTIEVYPASSDGTYPKCTTVTLKAVPTVNDGSYQLAGWTGDLADQSGNPIQLSLEEATSGSATFEEAWFDVYLDSSISNGSITTSPALDATTPTSLRGGTVVTVTPTAANGYVLDAVYGAYDGPYTQFTGAREATSYRTAPYEVEINRNDLYVGAYFVDESRVAGVQVTHDIVYAQPGEKVLKYDVYEPEAAHDSLPIVVIIHGGGWSSNNEDVMRGLATELAKTGKYVAFSIDYRWSGVNDGDLRPNTMANLIEDVFGAIHHIMDNASTYGGDANRVLVTGDSAGGHLAASVATLSPRIGTGGFVQDVWEFWPTNVPEADVADFRSRLLSSVVAVEPSYGAFNASDFDPEHDFEAHVSPQSNIPESTVFELPPQHLTRGSEDGLITEEVVNGYATALTDAGQEVSTDTIEGASHAYLDWKPDATTVATFDNYGATGIALMIEFFDDALSD